MEALIETQVMHCDRGNQYTCCGWIDLMDKQASKLVWVAADAPWTIWSWKGFFRTVRQEYICLNPMEKVCELRQGLSAFIHCYNTQRTHHGIGRVQTYKKNFMAA